MNKIRFPKNNLDWINFEVSKLILNNDKFNDLYNIYRTIRGHTFIANKLNNDIITDENSNPLIDNELLEWLKKESDES